MAPNERPDVVLSSPYLRAQSTAAAVQESSGFAANFAGLVIDERLREKEFGILDRLTRFGIDQRIPNRPPLAGLWGNSISGRQRERVGAT